MASRAAVLVLGWALAWGQIQQAAAGELSGPMVVSDAWPRATTPQEWARDVLRLEGKESASERDQALALYYWTRLFVMSPSAGMEPYEGPYGQEGRILRDVTKVMFVHGCGDCDYQARALEAVWCLYKGDDQAARRTNLMGMAHTMVELGWGGRWHAFDPLNGVFFLESDAPDADVIGHAQEAASDALLMQNEHFVNRARPFFERVRAWDGPGEWKDHLDFVAAFDSYTDWLAAGAPLMAIYGTHSLPSTYEMSDMRWHLPRGTRVERTWSASRNFYRPTIAAQKLGLQGRHYRQAVEWGPTETHWNAEEDLYDFPRVEPYLAVGEDPNDTRFYGNHTLYLVGSGVMTWEADLWSQSYLDAVEGPSTLVRQPTAPYLRPSAAGSVESITFRVRTPYIVADSELSARLDGGPDDHARFLLSTDEGASWEEVASGTGQIDVNLGKARFDGAHQSTSGKYGYLVRLEVLAGSDPATLGLRALKLTTYIDGSLNALPRIAAGANTVRFLVDDASQVASPIHLEYAWKAGEAEARASQTITAADFAGGEAIWRFEAPGLTRCSSYSFAYGVLDEDADGLPDSWERAFFGTTALDGNADPDGDGVDNAREFEAGTNPGALAPADAGEADASAPAAAADASGPDGGATPADAAAARSDASGVGSGEQRTGGGCSQAGSLGLIALGWVAWRGRSVRRP